ncbi:hypothetical protein FJTKL_14565 [Diaporthe vaccinii]|uniref:Uncharacterized protein n=1 Tax=Diaporthe vaccinii TaxID=105482 RepID=A0ABR4E7B8_9PEZI
MNAITLSYELFAAGPFCIRESSPSCAWAFARRRTISSTTLSPLSGSHPSYSYGSTLGLVMAILFALYRSLIRNHQPSGTPFKVCGIAAPRRALAEDHRYLALAELREEGRHHGPPPSRTGDLNSRVDVY